MIMAKGKLFVIKVWPRLRSWYRTREPATQQRLLWVGIAGIALLTLFLLGSSVSLKRTPEATSVKVDYSGASEALSPQEKWSEKISRQAEEVHKKFEAISTECAVLKKHLEALTQGVQALGNQQNVASAENVHASSDKVPSVSKESTTPLSLQNSSFALSHGTGPLGNANDTAPFEKPNNASPPEERKFGVLSLTNVEGGKTEKPDISLRIVENTVPAGSHVQAVLTSAVAASTATNSPNDPQPVTLRLMGDGNLPRGWKSSLKDAVLVGACYGDLSSERVLCRLTTLSMVESNGEVIEKDVEGWVVGEDGRYGIRGHVVDRAGIAARESFISGVLSGIAGFFQAQTTSSVFPVSPFGQTSALKGREMLTAGAANGVGKALDRLSEFYIKRAESMSPVLLVNAGRVVDVVFKKGLDLRGSFLRQRISGTAEKFRKQLALKGSGERRM